MTESAGKKALVLFSGGQDSTVCLAWALARFAEVETVGFDYGQSHAVELDCRDEVRAGLAALDVERLGRLHLELAENAGERELLVYLARAVPEYDVKAPRRVLERCHYRHADPMPLSGGVHKGNIILLTRFPERQATAAGIERAVQFLSGVMDTVAKA